MFFKLKTNFYFRAMKTIMKIFFLTFLFFHFSSLTNYIFFDSDKINVSLIENEKYGFEIEKEELKLLPIYVEENHLISDYSISSIPAYREKNNSKTISKINILPPEYYALT